MRVAILDILTLPAGSLTRKIYHPLITKQLASITPQAISVWCRQSGHETFYATYYGLGCPEKLLPEDPDIIFISCFTQASPLAYALAKLYRKKGVKTVIGGAHAKSFPQDCLRFFDIVVKYCDKNLIDVILKGDIRPGTYISGSRQFTEFPGIEERMPEIRIASFMRGRNFFAASVPALSSTGCPYSCNFCTEWDNPYHLYSPEHLTADLKFLSKNYPEIFLVFQDPHFGIKFDYILDIMENTGSHNPYLIQTSVNVLHKKDRLIRLKNTNCRFFGAGVESWNGYSEKAAAGNKNGLDKVNEVVEHFRMINEYIPYGQGNFILGLDTDKGDEPFELTKFFIGKTPYLWSALSIPFPFGGTPLFNEQMTGGQILENMPFLFYYNPYLVMTLKNYTPVDYYKKMADLFLFMTGKSVIKQRLKNAPNKMMKFVHLVRTLGARVNARKYRQLALKMRSDLEFRRFHEGESRTLPEFYHQEFDRMLGAYSDLLSYEERCPDLGQPEPVIFQ